MYELLAMGLRWAGVLAAFRIGSAMGAEHVDAHTHRIALGKLWSHKIEAPTEVTMRSEFHRIVMPHLKCPSLRRLSTLCVFLLITYAAAFAVEPLGFTRKLWQTQDGLPEQTVQAFAQTADGYLWIGTTGGLLRFDGARFTVFDVEHTPQLQDNGVFALLTSRDGSLWIGTEGGGLVRYKSGVFRAYGSRDGLSDGFVRTIYEDRSGTIWVGTDNGLMHFVGGRLERVDGVNGVPLISVHSIFEDHLGGLWAGGNRLLRLAGTRAREYRLGGGSFQTSVKSILETQDHTLWVGTVSGLHRLRPGAVAFERVKDIRGTVRVLRQTSDGTLWVGLIGQGIRRWRGGSFSSLDASESLPSNTVLNIFEDNEKNLWIGTQAGMLRLTRTPVRIIPLPQATDSDFGTIYQDRDGTLWVISTDIFRLRKGVAEPYTFPQLGPIRARNVYRDREGALWIGTDGDGVIRLSGQSVMRLTSKEGLINNFIRAFLESRDGSMWIMTDNGVSRWTPHGIVNYEMSDGLSHFSTRAAVEDRNGDIWIGTEHGLSHFQAGIFIRDTATVRLSQLKVWAIHEDADGGLWFGTRNDGLYRWRRDKLTHYTKDQGLASNSIYQILEDARGGFWISGPNGISLLNRHELDMAAENPAQHLSLTLYGISDEVQSTQIYGGRQPSGCLGLQGDVWFPSNGGPINIAWTAIPQSPMPPVVVDEVQVDGRPVAVNHPLVMEPNNGRLEISYAPILLRSQEGVRFRYRLEGFEEKWIDASARRVASYTNLPPGKFTFHVLAFEVNNPRAISESSFSIVQRPHFYKTLWFVACCILVLVALILGVYRFRLWQIKMRFEAVLDERSRLAREMHDTVIQGCASVSALLEAVSSLSPTDTRLTQDLMDHARTQVRTTIDEARQTVWNLRQEKPSGNVLGPALQRMVEQIANESGIPITCEVIGKPFVLNQFVTHELMMMAREGVYNAVLHARPGKIELIVCFEKKDLMLDLRDDGSGFDPAVIPPREGRHYGLVGMQERVHAVGGKFTLESTLGKGTHLRILIPRKVSAAQSVMLGA